MFWEGDFVNNYEIFAKIAQRARSWAENPRGGGCIQTWYIDFKSPSDKGKYPAISSGQKPAYIIDKFCRDGETITIEDSGIHADFMMFWSEPIFVSAALSAKANELRVLPRLNYHFLPNIQRKIFELKSGGGISRVYAKDVPKLTIFVPPLAEQERIAAILCQFDTSVNSIGESLPKGIQLGTGNLSTNRSSF